MKKLTSTKKDIFISAVIFLFLTAFSSMVYAYPGGITGRTLKSGTTGCSTCHTQGTAVNGSLTGPDTVLVGQTNAFTITINHTNSGLMGCDIAIQRGTLAVGGGSAYVHLTSGELTHNSGISGTSIQISFNYTAPSSVGWDTLYATVAAGHAGNWRFLTNKHIFVKSATGITNQNMPLNFKLNQNYPNPFNPVSKISFSIGKTGMVKLTVFDVLGNEVATLLNEQKEAGDYSIEFNGEKLSSGVYFYKLESGQFTDIKRMTLIK